MQQLIFEILALLAGFTFLSRGADALVDGGVALARRWGLEPTVIGLTVIAWGTSMPEIVVSGYAAWVGKAGASIGTVLGSNVANIGLVLGVTATILPAVLRGGAQLRDGIWLLASLGLLAGLTWDGTITRIDAGILLAAFLIYEVMLFVGPGSGSSAPDDTAEAVTPEVVKPFRAVLLGSVVIAVGARAVMYGGEGLALRLGIPPTVVGLTVFAIGTSLPELAAGIGSARRGHAGIGLGNVIGSNLFNTLAVMGVAGLVKPIALVPSEVQSCQIRDLPTTLGFSIALLVLPFALKGKGRAQAVLLLAGYVAYVSSLVLQGRI